MYELTYRILKIETKSSRRLCRDMMKMALKRVIYFPIRKYGKIIMISKGGDVDNSMNWRPII
jgi:hypothetical protein